MTVEIVIILLKSLGAVLILLFLFILFTKIMQMYQANARKLHIQAIKPELEYLFDASDSDFRRLLEQDLLGLHRKTKNRLYRAVLEEFLLEYLENRDRNSDQKVCKRALSLAYKLNLPHSCLLLIKSHNNRNVASGCRKAGLYQYEQAIPEMIKALSVLSSDTHFQILMGLARIGNVSAMKEAFDRISGFVLVNERAIAQILTAFSGDRYELFKRMIHHEVEYVSLLSLKAMDKDTAKVLKEEIVSILNHHSKEMRIAAIKIIGRTEDEALSDHFVQALEDSDWEVRAIAAKMLGVLRNPYARAPLAKAICDSQWWVRQNAAEAILSYPNCQKMLFPIIEKRDAYARDSIIYALEKAKKHELLLQIRVFEAQMKDSAKKLEAYAV